MSIARDLQFLYEIGTMRNLQRAWRQTLGVDVATNPEHTFRVAFIALTLARMEGVQNDEKILKMALVHDLGEARTLDLNYTAKMYVKIDEHKAAHDTLDGTMIRDLLKVFEEYERRACIEAKIVKDADNLDVDLELKELEERGHKLPKKWGYVRSKIVHDKKLHTKSAKKLWKAIQKSDPAAWHLTHNKWYKMPDTGR